MVDTLPYDVWSLIARNLPKRDVERWSGISREMRKVGLDARFRDVKIDKRNHSMKILCDLLGRDSNDIAPHVRKLVIEPWLVQPRTKCCMSKSENFCNRVRTFFNSTYIDQEAEKRVRKRIHKDIQRVSGAISQLKNVIDYQILWDETSTSHHREFFDVFLSPALEMLSASLTRLTLKVPFQLLSNLSYVHLPELEHLDVHLCTGDASMTEIHQGLDGFFVFVHNLRNLRHLGITATHCSRQLDLSDLAERWGTFAKLRSFSLCMPFNGGLLPFPEKFYLTFLKPHAKTLESLELKSTNRCTIGSDGLRQPSNIYWVQEILSSFDVVFPCLRELNIALRPLKGDLGAISRFLTLRAPTLERLSLTDRALRNNEADELFAALCDPSVFPARQNHVLRRLGIRLHILNVPILISIAEYFPDLEMLGLTFGDVSPYDVELRCCSDKDKLNKFSFFLGSYIHKFRDWGIRRIDMVKDITNSPWTKRLEKAFLESFPSLTNIGELPPPTS